MPPGTAKVTSRRDVNYQRENAVSLDQSAIGNAVLAQARSPENSTVLMIDDEKLNSFVVAVYLKAGGYRELVHTTDPLAAIALAERTHPDAILLDIEMPRLDGIQLLRQIRSNTALSQTHVLILSATDDERIKAEARTLGVAGFLKKPIKKEELLSTLAAVLSS
jgi:CheY-like chemotaxis protein